MTRPWRVVLEASGRRDLNDLPEKYVLPILETLKAIAINPDRLGKPLRTGLRGSHAARCGPFRILYDIDRDSRTVEVFAIDHRSHVYRQR